MKRKVIVGLVVLAAIAAVVAIENRTQFFSKAFAKVPGLSKLVNG